MEYRSGGTGGPYPGVDIFPMSPRPAKPYCGVKCSQGLHFPHQQKVNRVELLFAEGAVPSAPMRLRKC